MSTSQYDGVNLRIFRKEEIQMFLYKVICTGTIKLVILNQRNPHRACLTRNLDVREHLPYLQRIRLR